MFKNISNSILKKGQLLDLMKCVFNKTLTFGLDTLEPKVESITEPADTS
jgi:hypothetical protein